MFYLGDLGQSFVSVLLSLVAILMAMGVAIPFHEFAHAYVARKQGDYTATACKRCTLGAFAHFDLTGFFMLLLFGFGWAKPVPVDERNYKNGRKSKFLVSIAGILMNLLLGVVFLFIYVLICKLDINFYDNSLYGFLLRDFLVYSVNLNFGLALFNLLPIYPLDGYNIIASFSRDERNNAFLYFSRRYSYFIFLLILITGIYSLIYSAVIGSLYTFLIDLFCKILGI